MPHPSIFYKYTIAETAEIILKTGKLRWSSPVLFNDPSEWKRMPRFEPTIEDDCLRLPHTIVEHIYKNNVIDESKISPALKFTIDGLKTFKQSGFTETQILQELSKADFEEKPDEKLANMLREKVDEDIKQARVLCVTTDYANEVMWAHYAKNFTGCVLGFRHIPEKDTPLLAATKVNYTKDAPVIGSGLDLILYGDTPDLRKKSHNAIFYTKKHKWAYEEEWRIITWRRNEGNALYGDYPFFSEELDSVTLGTNCSKNDEEKIRNSLSLKYPQAKLFKLNIKDGNISREIIK